MSKTYKVDRGFVTHVNSDLAVSFLWLTGQQRVGEKRPGTAVVSIQRWIDGENQEETVASNSRFTTRAEAEKWARPIVRQTLAKFEASNA